MILESICEDPDIATILGAFKSIIRFATIAVPVILIIFVIIDIIKTISSQDVDTKKLTKSVSARLIAAIMVFLVPSIIEFVIGIIPNSNNQFIICYQNAGKITVDLTKLEGELRNAVCQYQATCAASTDGKSTCAEAYYDAAMNKYNLMEKAVNDYSGSINYQSSLTRAMEQLRICHENGCPTATEYCGGEGAGTHGGTGKSR